MTKITIFIINNLVNSIIIKDRLDCIQANLFPIFIMLNLVKNMKLIK